MLRHGARALPLALATAIMAGAAIAATVQRDVPFVATPPEVVQRMLEMAGAGPNDVLYDLGSGDGRIVVTALRRYKVRKGVGIDIDPQRIAEANQAARAAGVADRAEFRQANLFEADFSEASVLTMYLLTSVNMKLRPRLLRELKPGTRIVSHQFRLGDWEPDASDRIGTRDIHMWVVPARVQGRWQWSPGGENITVALRQEFQRVSGTVRAFGSEAPLRNAKLVGNQLLFEAALQRDGAPVTLRAAWVVNGDRANGKLRIGERALEGTASRTEGS